MRASTSPLPPTPAECRVVLLYLLSLSVRPVEDTDEDQGDDRPPLYLSRAALADDWDTFATRSKVRAALGIVRPSARFLGPTRLFRVIDTVSAATYAHGFEQAAAEVAELRAEVGVAAAMVEVQEQILSNEVIGEEAPDQSALRAALRVLRDARGAVRSAEDRLSDFVHRGRNFSAVSPRTHGRASARRDRHLVRLLRDDETSWETALGLFGDDPDDYGDLTAEAEALGFTLHEPLPADWTRSVRTRLDNDQDDDDDQDDEPAPSRLPVSAPTPAPVEEPTKAPRTPVLRPVFTSSPLPPMSDPLDVDRSSNYRPTPEPVPETMAEMQARFHAVNLAAKATAERERLASLCKGCGKRITGPGSIGLRTDCLSEGACHAPARRSTFAPL